MFPDVATQMKTIERGVLDIFPKEELVKKLEKSRKLDKPLRIKLGIDPTSPDIHLGHAVPFNKLRHFQELGHQIVIIIGDYTAMVGDPSGRDSTRPQITHEQVMENAKTYLDQVRTIIDLDKAEVVYNGDWFSKMSFTDVIKLSSRMTVARLLERDDFSKRYKEGLPISFHEFMYPLMQGHDSVMVRADVELGGNDQTFNLLVGRNLQKEDGQEPQVALTLPLLVGTDGTAKMSKSYGNYIGVSEVANDMYGKVMSVPDALLKNYFDLCSDVPEEEAAAFVAGNPMEAKMALAKSIVERYHDAEAATHAAANFNRTVRNKELPDDIPEIAIPADLIVDGAVWIAKLITLCGFAPSTSEARRLVAQGAVSIDGEAIKDVKANVTPKAGALLKVGKRKYARVSM
jgi:tyrosyl-tRNA synthetase